MAYGVALHVWGPYACFTRPEMKVERVSYEVMTPSAARGVMDAIMWRPEMRWIVHRIEVLRPIRFVAVRRNELQSKIAPRTVQK
ncbi:MAG TPA: type I-C CRISPR-associated protein Cas5, partial [Spirochaetia bacterium]|nr:type I-C CRISPR-associated protein Cas5 [Spirochaetia bacterium]